MKPWGKRGMTFCQYAEGCFWTSAAIIGNAVLFPVAAAAILRAPDRPKLVLWEDPDELGYEVREHADSD